MTRWRKRLGLEWPLFREAASDWSDHDAPRMGAALAYYTILSLSPLVVILLAIGRHLLGDESIRTQLLLHIREAVGSQAAGIVQNLLNASQNHTATGVVASVFGFVMLLIGASGVFGELRDDLNYIWNTSPPTGSTFRNMLKYRLFSAAAVLAVGFLGTLSLAASIIIQGLEKFAAGFVPLPAVVLEIANFVVTLLITGFFFGLIYRLFPARKLLWSDVFIGALMTALLFGIGRVLVALYLGTAAVGSAYGAAGSLVVLLVWVYYSSQIFLFGAEFTHVYSLHRNSPASRAQESNRQARSSSVSITT